ncbi:hypothetical protein P3H80_03275 [Mycolicibacterium septicum]|uniref:hypothetical protein n=1 Tax=Mycolicibacterium septicum TaxID=98668 RepID=UPI0023E20EF1|nr:hypothetical protein [Mycolicibacterium septicum]MDF3336422.1 hypothetical protein [Mycolicibacterium septicum]
MRSSRNSMGRFRDRTGTGLLGVSSDARSGQSRTVATLGINTLLGSRATAMFFRTDTQAEPDDRYSTEWTTMLAARIADID